MTIHRPIQTETRTTAETQILGLRQQLAKAHRILTASIRMLGPCCFKGASGGSVFTVFTTSSLVSPSHLNSDLGGIRPSRLNQQRLPSMSRHHQ
jgi:hypothetical protein